MNPKAASRISTRLMETIFYDDMKFTHDYVKQTTVYGQKVFHQMITSWMILGDSIINTNPTQQYPTTPPGFVGLSYVVGMPDQGT